MAKTIKRKRSTRPVRQPRRRTNTPSTGARAAGAALLAESHRMDRGQRMLEIGSHMISFYMFLSHRLLPLVDGGPPAGEANSPNRFAGQFNEVRRSLLKVVGHHPVLRGKIERLSEDTDRMVADAGRYPTGHPNRVTIQQEAKLLNQRLRENSRAMSDLVAVLRNV